MGLNFAITLPRAAYTVGVARRFLGAALDSAGIHDDGLRDDLLSAAAEACANAIDHGYPAEDYKVRMEIASDSCALEITDSGVHFNPDSVAEPDMDSESGRGIYLMRELMDSVVLEQAPGGGTRVHLRKQRPGLLCAAGDGGRLAYR
jgi:serine/threonine-protein kinase RsbW